MSTSLDFQKDLTNLLQNADCSICKQKIKESLMCPSCQKCFCKECINKWLLSKETCPLCIKEINQSSLIKSKIIDEIARVAALVEKGDLCQTHNLFKDYYCKDCKKLYCSDCLLLDKHDKNHIIIRKPSEKLISKIVNDFNSSQLLIEDYVNKYNNMIKEIERKIDEYRKEQVTVLAFLKELTQQSCNKYKEIIDSLIDKKDLLKKEKDSLSNINNKILRLITSIKKYEIPSDIDTLLNKMEKLIKNRKPGELLFNECKFNPIEYYFKGNTFIIKRKLKETNSYTLNSNFAAFKITFRYNEGKALRYFHNKRLKSFPSNPNENSVLVSEIELLSNLLVGTKMKYSISVGMLDNKIRPKIVIHSFSNSAKLKIDLTNVFDLKKNKLIDNLIDFEIIIKPEGLQDYIDEIENYKLLKEKRKCISTSQSLKNFNLNFMNEPSINNEICLTAK